MFDNAQRHIRQAPTWRIVVGPRHRRTIGNLAVLAAGIRDDTHLQPIAIRSAGTLISAAHRSQAAKLLGLTKVSGALNDRVDPRRDGFAGSVDRKSFTPSELVAIGADIDPIECQQVKARKAHGGRPRKLMEHGGDSEWRDFKIDDHSRFELLRARNPEE
jgi:hypothetical protein